MSRVVVIGDALLDFDVEGRVDRLSPDAPVPVVEQAATRARPGGAALAAALAAADASEVTLITAVGEDAAGRELRALLREAGVDLIDLGLRGETPQKMRVIGGGQSLLRVDSGVRDGSPVRSFGEDARAALEEAGAVLVSDYGRGMTRAPSVREALAAHAPRAPLVWDPHPAGGEPVPGARLVTPNGREAALLAPGFEGDGLGAVTARARLLASRWAAAGVSVTLGSRGALVVWPDAPVPLHVPARAKASGDACGAGDRFAACAAARLADGAVPSEAVVAAVEAASSFVAAGGARAFGAYGLRRPALPAAGEDAFQFAERVRSTGGTVVATGGCFDLLHPGHIATLRAARALGDCLIVCVNSDASVRALKGPQRPIVSQEDRASVLMALDCVDAVAIFDELTPERVLDRLRPAIWAKGGDYTLADLPEAELVARWGGQAVVLPYLDGRSTTRLVKEVVARVDG